MGWSLPPLPQDTGGRNSWPWTALGTYEGHSQHPSVVATHHGKLSSCYIKIIKCLFPLCSRQNKFKNWYKAEKAVWPAPALALLGPYPSAMLWGPYGKSRARLAAAAQPREQAWLEKDVRATVCSLSIPQSSNTMNSGESLSLKESPVSYALL